MSENELKQQSTSILASIKRFYSSNPLIGVIGSIASVISCTWLIITLVQGGEQRDLAFLCNPIRTPIVQADLPKAMQVFHNEQKIEGDVTAVQFALWNRGKKEIASEDVLKNVEIYLDPQVPILDAEIRQWTREDIIGLEIDKTKFKSGIIPITWKILEKDDGCLVQVIYLGKSDVQIKMKGALIGQRVIREVKSSVRIQTPSQQLSDKKLGSTLGLAMTFLSAILAIFLILSQRRLRKSREELRVDVEKLASSGILPDLSSSPKTRTKHSNFYQVLLLLYPILGLILWFFFLRSPIKSPFGF